MSSAPPVSSCDPPRPPAKRKASSGAAAKQQPKTVYASSSSSGLAATACQPDASEHVILQLHVNDAKKGASFKPVDEEECLHAPVSSCPGADDDACSADTAASSLDLKPSGGTLKAIKLLMDFEEKSKNREWPSTTSVHCYWCCHKFNSVPFGLPVKMLEDRYGVTGCYCSLECAAAYNFDSHHSIDDILERYHLINVLAKKLGVQDGVVKPAPPRTALTAFGGHMSIDEFRAFAKSPRVMISNYPPMQTLSQQIEEISEKDVRKSMRYVPIDTERVNRYKEQIKLKRSKPLLDAKNTLDYAMNLRFS